ncbi:hypothetical protein K469DRAFT_690779 [Zopfia rhizophila CBS 207.26]|uniref:Uncharacterized protein n=1 Tax=Zopfia rhizophila CBS 207.26 TaxID=1314779 RepID=A0A6A6DWX6_9PEZI|nr:hypothetical protein K469DRAFT_690779 [Zopfia rhizophila CBS 207.26]
MPLFRYVSFHSILNAIPDSCFILLPRTTNSAVKTQRQLILAMPCVAQLSRFTIHHFASRPGISQVPIAGGFCVSIVSDVLELTTSRKEDGAGVLSHEVNKSCLESAVKNIEKFFLPYLPEGIQIPIKSKDNNGDNSSYRKKRIRKALEQSSEAVNGLPPNSKRVCSERRRARPPVENSERSQALTPAENSERSLALTPAENSERSLALTPAENSERSQALTLADNVVEDGASKELWSVLALDEDIGKLDAVERFQSLLQFESKAVGMVNNLGEKQAKSFFMAEMKKAGVSENRKSSYRRHQEVVLSYSFDSTYAVIRAALRKDRDGRYGDEEAYVSDFLGELESYKGDKRIGQQPFDLLGFFERVFPNTTREEICDAISFHSILGSEPRLAVSTTAEVSESGNADILSRNEPELPSGSSSPNAQPTSGSSNDRESQKDSTQPGQDAVEKNSRLPTPLPDSDDTELPFNLAFDPTAPFNHPFDPTHNDPQPFNLAFDPTHNDPQPFDLAFDPTHSPPPFNLAFDFNDFRI